MKVDPFIEAEKVAGHNVDKACRLLEVSKSAYYERRNGAPSTRQQTDAALLAQIRVIHAESKGTYGAPRIHKELLHRHVPCGKRRVTRLMRQAGLAGRCKKRWRTTTIADPAAEAARDLIGRHFGPTEEMDRRYVGDITYIATWEGWSYLATVIDLASRRVVGWALADHMRTELVEDALKMAFAQRAPDKGVIFHSDRGCQYTSGDFATLARANGVVLSVGRKGECWDKALVSYCTSCRWSGQNSLIEPASHAFDQGRVAGRGRLEEPDVLVVGLVRDEQTGTVPGLDGRGAHAEERGDLGNGEQTASTESFEVAWQTIAAA